jgi:uncharacterized protein (TIGR03086 family)
VSTALTGAVELLDRSLAYTRAALALVTPDRLGDPTPCTEWDVAALLRHMDDGLDAFTEAATGSVALTPATGSPGPASIRAKACALLGWWCEHPPPDVRIGGLPMPSGLLVGTAALEITVHGWDLHQALGTGWPVPTALAEELRPVAELTVGEEDRPARFGPARVARTEASADERLLAHLGRG